MLLKKKNSVKQKRIDPISLNLFIFTVKQQFGDLKDHSLLAYYINQKFKLNITKEDIDDFYGFNDILVVSEDYELENRKHFISLQK